MKKTISRLAALQDLELRSPNKRCSEAETLRSQIPGTILERFDKFIVRGKKGVALVQNGVCRGCQIALPVGVINGLIQGLNAQVCGNCGRYLYLPESEAAAFQAGTRADTIIVSKEKTSPIETKTKRAIGKAAKNKRSSAQ